MYNIHRAIQFLKNLILQLLGLWNGDAAPERISNEPAAPDPISTDTVSNPNIVLKLISTLGLQRPAVALQHKLNSAVDAINSLLGETPDKEKVRILH